MPATAIAVQEGLDRDHRVHPSTRRFDLARQMRLFSSTDEVCLVFRLIGRSLDRCRSSCCILDRCRRHGRRLDDSGRRLDGLHLAGCRRSCRRLYGPTTGVGAAAAASPAAAAAAATPGTVSPGAGAAAWGVAGVAAAASTSAGLHHPHRSLSWILRRPAAACRSSHRLESRLP